jgi:hypothetical protein
MPSGEINECGGPPTVEAVRARLFEGLVSVETFAAAANRTPRQVHSWIAQGLPIVRIGKTPWIKVEPARDWLYARKWNPGGTVSSPESVAA